MIMERILVDIHMTDCDDDHKALACAIASAVDVFSRLKCDVVICIPLKGQAEGFLKKFISKETIARMVGGKSWKMNGVTFWLESETTLKKSRRKGAIIAIHTTLLKLKAVEAMGFDAVIYVPMNGVDGEKWRASHGPQNVSVVPKRPPA